MQAFETRGATPCYLDINFAEIAPWRRVSETRQRQDHATPQALMQSTGFFRLCNIYVDYCRSQDQPMSRFWQSNVDIVSLLYDSFEQHNKAIGSSTKLAQETCFRASLHMTGSTMPGTWAPGEMVKRLNTQEPQRTQKKNTGAPKGDLLGWINPFSKREVNCRCNSFKAGCESRYGLRDGGLDSGSRSISWSICLLVAIVQEVHLELCLGIHAVAPASLPSCHHLVKELSVLILLQRSSP